MRGRGEGGIYKRKSDGLWTAVIELPAGPNGARRRKTVTSKYKQNVVDKMTELQADLKKSGDLPTASQTLESWLNIWLNKIVAVKNQPKTIVFYRGMVNLHIIPAIGKTRLDKLTPAHVRRMTDSVLAKGLSSTTAGHAHRVLAIALKAAERDSRVRRNVAKLTDAPRTSTKALVALTAEQGIEVLRASVDDVYGSLWAAVLLTGARQGELLGLELDRVTIAPEGDDKITSRLDLSWQLQRLSWEHGCGEPYIDLNEKTAYPCGRARGAECPKQHLTFPPNWEHRHITGGLWWSRPKTPAGWRIIPLVEPLRTIIERQAALPGPNPHNLLWRKADGSPIDPRAESEAWDALLKRAGVPDVRLHDGRHTTVDLLYEAGVPEDIIMMIVGHSTRSTTRGYKSGNKADPRMVKAMQSLARMLEQ